MPDLQKEDWLETLHLYILFYFTQRGIPKSVWMEEYTLFEIVDLLMRDIRETAKNNLVQIQMHSIPLILLSENGGKEIKKQSEALIKIAGIEFESSTRSESNADDLEDIKDLLKSFKKGG